MCHRPAIPGDEQAPLEAGVSQILFGRTCRARIREYDFITRLEQLSITRRQLRRASLDAGNQRFAVSHHRLAFKTGLFVLQEWRRQTVIEPGCHVSVPTRTDPIDGVRRAHQGGSDQPDLPPWAGSVDDQEADAESVRFITSRDMCRQHRRPVRCQRACMPVNCVPCWKDLRRD
jgi:hypothetical protein